MISTQAHRRPLITHFCLCANRTKDTIKEIKSRHTHTHAAVAENKINTTGSDLRVRTANATQLNTKISRRKMCFDCDVRRSFSFRALAQ